MTTGTDEAAGASGVGAGRPPGGDAAAATRKSSKPGGRAYRPVVPGVPSTREGLAEPVDRRTAELPMAAEPKPDNHNGVVTELLARINGGDTSATGDLFQVLYREIHRSAERLMAGQPAEHTLQATALVNEVYLRLVRPRTSSFQDEHHFLATAATAMRCVLVDHARRKRSKPWGNKGPAEALDTIVVSYEERAMDLLALDEAIEDFRRRDEQMARAIDLRFFAGLGSQKVAEILGMKLRTFERSWQATRLWLYNRLQ